MAAKTQLSRAYKLAYAVFLLAIVNFAAFCSIASVGAAAVPPATVGAPAS